MLNHYTPLINILVASFGFAFLFGYLMYRLHISPIVGYLIAGVLIGPYTPGYTADKALASQLAEIGVILLMFSVGLHFSLQDLHKVKKIAIPGAITQMAIASLLGTGFAYSMGWTLASGLVFGLALSVASTVVLLRALQEWHLVKTVDGRIAIGWLIVEDLAVIFILVFMPPLAKMAHQADETTLYWSYHLATNFLVTLLKAASFIALMFIFGKRALPRLLYTVAREGSNELFRLAVLAIALVVAFTAAHLFGVSLALGAFFAGMFLSKSTLSQRAAQETLSLRDAFTVLFFVSVGMLLRPVILIEHPFYVLTTVLIITVGKSIAAFFIVILFRYPLHTALIISVSLAQIGEFSFILAQLGYNLGILSEKAKDLLLAGAFISIMINPLLFKMLNKFSLLNSR